MWPFLGGGRSVAWQCLLPEHRQVMLLPQNAPALPVAEGFPSSTAVRLFVPGQKLSCVLKEGPG